MSAHACPATSSGSHTFPPPPSPPPWQRHRSKEGNSTQRQKCTHVLGDGKLGHLAEKLQRLTNSLIDDCAMRALQRLSTSDAADVLHKVDGLVRAHGNCRNLSSRIYFHCRERQCAKGGAPIAENDGPTSAVASSNYADDGVEKQKRLPCAENVRPLRPGMAGTQAEAKEIARMNAEIARLQQSLHQQKRKTSPSQQQVPLSPPDAGKVDKAFRPKPPKCSGCGAAGDLKRCTGCWDDAVVYCSKSCQLAHWPVHRPACCAKRRKLEHMEKEEIEHVERHYSTCGASLSPRQANNILLRKKRKEFGASTVQNESKSQDHVVSDCLTHRKRDGEQRREAPGHRRLVDIREDHSGESCELISTANLKVNRSKFATSSAAEVSKQPYGKAQSCSGELGQGWSNGSRSSYSWHGNRDYQNSSSWKSEKDWQSSSSNWHRRRGWHGNKKYNNIENSQLSTKKAEVSTQQWCNQGKNPSAWERKWCSENQSADVDVASNWQEIGHRRDDAERRSCLAGKGVALQSNRQNTGNRTDYSDCRKSHQDSCNLDSVQSCNISGAPERLAMVGDATSARDHPHTEGETPNVSEDSDADFDDAELSSGEEDAPMLSAGWEVVRREEDACTFKFGCFERPGSDVVEFRVGFEECGGCEEQAQRIARRCYWEFEQGATEEEVTQYKVELCRQFHVKSDAIILPLSAPPTSPERQSFKSMLEKFPIRLALADAMDTSDGEVGTDGDVSEDEDDFSDDELFEAFRHMEEGNSDQALQCVPPSASVPCSPRDSVVAASDPPTQAPAASSESREVRPAALNQQEEVRPAALNQQKEKIVAENEALLTAVVDDPSAAEERRVLAAKNKENSVAEEEKAKAKGERLEGEPTQRLQKEAMTCQAKDDRSVAHTTITVEHAEGDARRVERKRLAEDAMQMMGTLASTCTTTEYENVMFESKSEKVGIDSLLTKSAKHLDGEVLRVENDMSPESAEKAVSTCTTTEYENVVFESKSQKVGIDSLLTKRAKHPDGDVRRVENDSSAENAEKAAVARVFEQVALLSETQAAERKKEEESMLDSNTLRQEEGEETISEGEEELVQMLARDIRSCNSMPESSPRIRSPVVGDEHTKISAPIDNAESRGTEESSGPSQGDSSSHQQVIALLAELDSVVKDTSRKFQRWEEIFYSQGIQKPPPSAL